MYWCNILAQLSVKKFLNTFLFAEPDTDVDMDELEEEQLEASETPQICPEEAEKLLDKTDSEEEAEDEVTKVRKETEQLENERVTEELEREAEEKAGEEEDRLELERIKAERLKRKQSAREEAMRKKEMEEKESAAKQEAEAERARQEKEECEALAAELLRKRRLALKGKSRADPELDAQLRKARLEAEADAAGERDKRKRSGSGSRRGSTAGTDTVAGASMLNLPQGYRAVRSGKIRSLAVRPLEGGTAVPFSPIGGFSNDYDNRIKHAYTTYDYTNLRNICSSFDLDTFTCTSCTHKGSHRVLSRKAAGGDGTEQAPPCFVLSDQNCPPLVPAEGEGDCLKIIQVENASLSDLTDVFLAAVKGYAMPAGTVVLIGSVSHLAAVGTAGYAEDLVGALAAIRNTYRSGISVMHGIPLLLGGLTNSDTIRDLLEVDLWYNSVSKSDTMEIVKTRALFRKSLIREGTDTCTAVNSAPESRVLRLPQSLNPPLSKLSYRSQGFGKQGNLCLPMKDQEETDLLLSLIVELNEKAGLDLSQEFCVDRCLYEECEGEESLTLGTHQEVEKLIILGSSHSSRASFEFDTNRFEVRDLSTPGWRISEESVEEKLAELKDEVLASDERKTTVFYQLFDNSSFWVSKKDGSRVLPEKERDRKYHVDGRLEVAGKEDAKRMVAGVQSLLRAGGGCRKLWQLPCPDGSTSHAARNLVTASA